LAKCRKDAATATGGVERRLGDTTENDLAIEKIGDVAIRRWQKVTGKEAVRVSDGKTFGEIASVAGADKGGSGDGQ
jgi:hypothetical protein